jgi:hypothetical protein
MLVVKRRFRLPQLVAAVMLLPIAGCVVVPYPVSNETVQTDGVDTAGQVYVTVGPRELIDDVSRRIVKLNPNIELVDPLTFRDTAFPEGGWSLQELLESDRCTQVAEQLDMQYLVLLTPAVVETGEEEGFFFPLLIGAMAVSEDSTLNALIIDLRDRSVVSQLSASSSGRGRMLYYVIIIVAADPMTESAVIRGLSESIAETLAVESHFGSLRIAVLAAEASENIEGQPSASKLLSPEEIEKQSKRRLFEAKLNKEIGTYCPNADLGHADAQKHIGDLYYLGTHGIKRDLILAYVWYSLAAMGENKEATKQLQPLVDELSPHQADEAVRQLLDWKPGQCERDLNDAILESPIKESVSPKQPRFVLELYSRGKRLLKTVDFTEKGFYSCCNLPQQTGL